MATCDYSCVQTDSAEEARISVSQREAGFFDCADLISVYSREQALADGVLVDVSALAAEAGFRIPVALTSAVWAHVVPGEALVAQGQSTEGRLWDVLVLAAVGARRSSGESSFRFDAMFLARGSRRERISLKAVCGPGDDAEPVITIMLPDED